MAADKDYVSDAVTGDWRPASDPATAAAPVVDAGGNAPADGDLVTPIRDLKVTGTSMTLKRGTVVRTIRLTGDPGLIDCRHEAVKGLVPRAEFGRKRQAGAADGRGGWT